MSTALSIGECARHALGGELPGDCPVWPPDIFAVAGEILLRSGAYRHVVHEWPPKADWNRTIVLAGQKWRDAAGREPAALPPKEVRQWWDTLRNAAAMPLNQLATNAAVAHQLLQLLAAADEASANAGLYVGEADNFAVKALDILAESHGRTLCRTIDATRATVLPKMHTPQTGLTFRSLSHHLALYTGREMRAQWHSAPRTTDLSRVLLLPWPLHIASKAFKTSKPDVSNLPACYGFFQYETTPATRGFKLSEVHAAVAAATKVAGGPIDAVILPELALREDDYVELCETLDTIVIAGVGRKNENGKWQNHAAFGFPNSSGVLVQKQSKHHRWRLDGSQVEQYGLGDAFTKKEFWWEHIELGERKLHFLNLNTWLGVTVLICEDLARQEPVSELVRAVGPTMVVALLMDGPQLLRRWPGRYAAVLADDPGTSVLTLTSVGMARLSKPKDGPASSVFALWNDAKSRPVEIAFEDEHAVGVVLKLRRESFEEWTADGRSDHGETSYLLLDGKPIDVII